MDSFFGIGVFELVFILIFALIFLGPERLPEVMRQVIGAIRQIRSLTSDITKQFNDEFGDLAELDPRRQIQQALKEDPAPKTPAKKTTPPKTTTTKTTPSPASKTVTAPKKNVTAKPKAAEGAGAAQSVDGDKPAEAATTSKTQASEATPEPSSSQAGRSTGTVAVHPTPEAKPNANGEAQVSSAEMDTSEPSTPVHPHQPTTGDPDVASAALAQTAKPENGTIHAAENIKEKINHSGAGEHKNVSTDLAAENLEAAENYSIAPPNLREQAIDERSEPTPERSEQRATEEESA
jgi:Tat protein translocase TatB subunit